MDKIALFILTVIASFILVMQITSIFIFSEKIEEMPSHIVLALNGQVADMEDE